MAQTIRAHFDGKVIVPDEPVDLAVGERVDVLRTGVTVEQEPTPEQRRAAIDELLSRPLPGPGIPDWALSREYIYEDDY